jgi:branched-chain amino acid transport system ATP-binding protein
MTAALAVHDLVAGYEPGLPIVRGAGFAVEAGEILAVLGPNGAGKSTLGKAVAGIVPVASGSVRLAGREIVGDPAHRMARLGLGFVPQTDNVFAELPVEDNLDLAAAVAGAPRARRIAEMFALFPDLGRQRRLDAGRLSGGQRQMLAVARALVAAPRVLILDEPSAGLSPKLAQLVFDKLAEIARAGVAIVLVEQNVRAALALAGRAIVLVEGRVRLSGAAAALAADPRLGDAFVGRGEAA